ncbi:ACP S-malonyltransferase [Escherichia coli]|uniref:ACP S-malonyltransferase n=2 Tax=Escherichia coli TaxID=562 RepID=UPI0009340EDE|nr:ACP S-malonyltransferase [Escherichia coli]MCS7413423.1 ACP S-malonyltransferase [Escherichia coli]
MMSLWDALRMNMMISYQELVRTFLSDENLIKVAALLGVTPESLRSTTAQLFKSADAVSLADALKSKIKQLKGK